MLDSEFGSDSGKLNQHGTKATKSKRVVPTKKHKNGLLMQKGANSKVKDNFLQMYSTK